MTERNDRETGLPGTRRAILATLLVLTLGGCAGGTAQGPTMPQPDPYSGPLPPDWQGNPWTWHGER